MVESGFGPGFGCGGVERFGCWGYVVVIAVERVGEGSSWKREGRGQFGYLFGVEVVAKLRAANSIGSGLKWIQGTEEIVLISVAAAALVAICCWCYLQVWIGVLGWICCGRVLYGCVSDFGEKDSGSGRWVLG